MVAIGQLRSRLSDEGLVVVAASALLICGLSLALAVVPPWQHPDEPTHTAVVELQRSRVALQDGTRDPGREGEILQSMARYDWWEHRARGFEAPTVVPENFLAAGRRVGVSSLDVTRPTTYYLVTARVLSWFPRLAVAEDLYLLRGLSAVLGALTLLVAWRGARECLGSLGGATVAVLLALHPQFALVFTSAAPDPVANFFGACLWWQAMVAFKCRNVIAPLVAVWAAAIVATSADRMGLPLVAIALVVSLAVLAGRTKIRWQRAVWVLPVAAGCLSIMLYGAVWVLSAFGETYGLGRVFSADLTPVPGAVTWSRFTRFTWLLHHSWWYAIGWGRYMPPAWWNGIAVALTLVVAAGVVRRFFPPSQPEPQARTFAALAAAGIAIQLSAVYWTYFRLGNGAQGRYLFPLLVPSLVLIWMGVDAWVPPSRRAHAAAALVLLFALLDASAWMLVAIPAYYGTL